VLWRRKWIILLVVVVATGAAYYFSARQTKQYQANADLIYEQQLDISNPLTGQTYTDPTQRGLELASVGSVLGSPDMAQRAATVLSAKGAATVGFTVSAQPVSDTGAAATTTSSNVVRVTSTSASPELAAAAANAYAVAFVAWRTERAQAQVKTAITAVKGQLASYHGATQQSTDYLVLAQRLQDLKILKATVTGNFRVLVPATVPQAPVSPKPLRSAILGFGVGLFAAIGLAFLLEQFDTRVRRSEQAAQILMQPILGRIPRISRQKLGENAVVALSEPDGHAAEAFRLVRTNLDFMSVDADVHSILVTSGIQGEGKSVTVANLAVAMALAGKKVVVVDADLRRPRQHEYFGLSNEHGVSTVTTDQGPLASALQPVALDATSAGANGVDSQEWAGGMEVLSRLFVLTSGPLPPNPGEIVTSQRFARLIETLSAEADVVLVDSPALLAVGDTAALASKVDGLVFLVDVHVATRPMLQQAAEQLGKFPCKPLGLIIRTDGEHRQGHYYSSYSSGYSYSQTGRKHDAGRGKPSVGASGQTGPAVAARTDNGEVTS